MGIKKGVVMLFKDAKSYVAQNKALSCSAYISPSCTQSLDVRQLWRVNDGVLTCANKVVDGVY